MQPVCPWLAWVCVAHEPVKRRPQRVEDRLHVPQHKDGGKGHADPAGQRSTTAGSGGQHLHRMLRCAALHCGKSTSLHTANWLMPDTAGQEQNDAQHAEHIHVSG
jgi:hypothetical protein